ncbi:P-loop containing nucleoside triphosphate hydrolase protein [Calocera cornea HHB12733]|uniref:p-loop containing nucleoside triphosphate hydrolase protein n=1 Tax=Calocera cornea HHB12733 TaxID=1353952 RepID=A0A165F758_9BASI|nr:P-loop containing nucleoside triphosphate hydrolase protein [Calocera cornea HHB12733]
MADVEKQQLQQQQASADGTPTPRASNGTLDIHVEKAALANGNSSGEKQQNGKKGGMFSKRKAAKDAKNDSTKPPPDLDDDPKPVAFTSLFRFATKFELMINLIGIICAAAAGAAQPLMSLIFGNLTNSFVNFTQIVITGTPAEIESAADDFRHVSAQDALYLVVIGIGMYVVTHLYMLIWTYTGEMNSKRVRENYLAAVLRQDIAFFDTLGAGEVATRISTDTHLIQQGTSEKIPLIVSFIAAFITGFVLAYIRSWRLALALTSIVPCISITGAIMNRFISKLMQKSLKAVADGGTLAEEVISTIRTTKAFGTQRILSALYDTHVAKAHNADMKAAVAHGVGLSCFFFIIYSAYALAFYYGTTLVLLGIGNVGVIVNVFLAILIGSFSLAMMAPEMQSVSHARGAASKLFATIDRVPTIDSASPAGKKLEHVDGHIALENVVFDYPSRPDVRILKGLSISFQAGKTAALVGASGSGKSTIVALVERFYDPIQGAVKLDGVDLRELNVSWLRSQIGLVSQEPTLFATTVRHNVEHGLTGTPMENASPEEKFALVKEACVKANADGFISKLPEGYDTNVGQAGLLLSGGQKQRIAIARAIVSNPKILLLDEATSALDTQSEGIVQNALDKASLGRTTITIAHRLSTIRDADQIYVMGDGQVLEHGTHNELLSNENGAYARLVNAQKLRERQTTDADNDDDALTTGEKRSAGALMTDAEAKEAAAAEIPLQRTGTGRSVGSEIMEKRRQQGLLPEQQEDRDYGFVYLFKRMGLLNREALKLYGFGTIFAICTGMVYPAFGIVYGITIQSFASYTGEGLRNAGNRNALWFFLIAVAASICIGFNNSFFGAAAAQLTRKLRSISFSSILRQDVTWFDEERHSTGALTAGLSDNPQKISGLGGVTLGAIVQSITTVIGGAIIGLCYGWKLGLVGIACIPFVISAGYIRLRVVVLKDQKNKHAHEESAQLACEVAGAIRTVASLTREKAACKEYSDSLEVPLRNSNHNSIFSTGFYALSQAMSFFAIALIFWYGSRLVASQEYTTEQFFICLMSVTFGAIQAGNVFTFVPDMSSAKGAAAATINLIDSEPEIDSDSTQGDKLPDVKGEIIFHDVHFRYPTRPGVRVLRNLSIHVNPGETVAICGASGCGKSTTIQLIERFYDPLAGTVTMDGIPITAINVGEYRKHIAIVSQEPTLYAGTVRFNILLGANKPAEEVTQEELEDACRDANILDFIQSLPDGFETNVGNKGTSLSGGQKQRIAIARALIRNPKVLLLDEATSALDSQSERVVQQALDVAARGRTTIAIAHRLSTIQNADRIYYLSEGKVAEVGTHDELLRLRGGYFELVQLQALSKRE